MIRVRARTNRRRGLDKLHRDVLVAMDEALAAADPARIIRKHLRLDGQTLRADKLRFPLKDFRRIFVIGGGKASGYMAEEVEKLVGDWITRGLVIIPDYLRPRPQGRRIKYHAATHPIPARKGMAGVLAMLDLVGNVSRDDMVIVLLSGGASALMPLPAQGMSLKDEARVTALLLKSGANIEEINTVRKHLSQVKGGRLAARLYPATVLSLIISDVVGARIAGRVFGAIARDIRDNALPFTPPWALVSGGETTVTVRGKGKGGRNQELVLAAATKINGSDGVVVGSFATDGIEGQTNAAGALADGTTVMRGLKLGMYPEQFLRNNDSYHYFSKLKDLVITGPTGTNVNDIMILAVGR